MTENRSPALPALRRHGDAGVGPSLLCWLLTAASMSAGLPAAAQQWQVTPDATIGVRYDDNITLDPEDPQSAFGPTARALVRALRSTENSELGLLGGLRLNEALQNRDLSDVAAFLRGDGSYQTPRSQFRFNLSLSTQSTLTSETATTGVRDINGQQYRMEIRPGWSYRLSERSGLGLNAIYTQVFYDGVDDGSFTDYRAGNLALSASRRLTEAARVSVLASYGQYRSQGDVNETDNLALQLGADYEVSETLTIDALFGLRRTEATFPDAFGLPITEDTTGPSYEVSIQKRLARGGELSLRARRGLLPSSAAEVLDTTSLRLGYAYPINERLSLGLSSQAYRNRQLSGETSGSDRTYADGQVNLSYRTSPTWRLVFSYRYRWQDIESEPSSADSNRVNLSLAWSGR